MVAPLLPWLAGASPIIALVPGAFVSRFLPEIKGIASRLIIAIDIESQAVNPDYKRAVKREVAANVAGQFVSLPSILSPQKIDILAANFRAIHQWTCVQASLRCLIALARGEPSDDMLREAALNGNILIKKRSSLDGLLPAINQVVFQTLKFIYYCSDVERSYNQNPGDSASYSLSNINLTLQLLQTQPQYYNWVMQKIPNVPPVGLKELSNMITSFKKKYFPQNTDQLTLVKV